MNFLATFSNKNCLQSKTTLNTNFLICSLLTLLPNDKLFQELNFNKHSPSTTLLNGKTCLIELGYLDNLFLLINKPLIRQLAYTVLQPLVQKKTTLANNLNIKKKSIEEQTLKKYLKKFKHFYKLFFLENSFLSDSPLTDKEINFLAIKFLFIFIGI